MHRTEAPAPAGAARPRQRFFRQAPAWLLVLLIGTLPAPPVHAEPQSPPQPDQPAPTAAHSSSGFIETLRTQAQTLVDAGRAEVAFDLVASHESAHIGDPDYDYLLGTIALAAGRHAAAVHALERVVLVQPSYAGAWLDLAIAHFRLGELDTADEILAHVEKQFDPPPALRTDIASVRRSIASARRWRGWQTELGAFGGHTSNANYGLAVSALSLSLDGMPATLLLDPSYRPRADGFGEVRASLSRRFELDAGRQADTSATLRHRRHGRENEQDQWDVAASGTWRRPFAWRGIEGATLFAGGQVRDLRIDQRGVSLLQASGGLRVPAGRCSLSGRLDAERRLFAAASEYDALIPWVGAGAECGIGEVQWGGQLRLGNDLAVNARPGGDTRRVEALGYARWQARPGLQLGAVLLLAASRDELGYSPLLADGQRRWVQRLATKLEAVWVPGADPRSPWAVVIEMESIRDRSNIGLSTLNIHQILTGLNYRF